MPPMYSAIKIGGKKLYELARKGREVERPPRKVTIHALTVEGQTGEGDFSLRVRCSKGTYVLTLCHDIGAVLGCGGCMSALRRAMASGFSLAQAHPLEEVLACPDPAALLLPVDGCFADLPRLDLPPQGDPGGAQRPVRPPSRPGGRGVPPLRRGDRGVPGPGPGGAGETGHRQELLCGEVGIKLKMEN